jgi:hypothetical protein
MGGACDLLPTPRTEPPHIQSTPDPPFPGHHGQETCRSGLVGLSTTLKLTGCQYNTNRNRFQLVVKKEFFVGGKIPLMRKPKNI